VTIACTPNKADAFSISSQKETATSISNMADNFDPCECISSTEWAMQRLLSVLRQSQQHCTENECLPVAPLSEQPPQESMWDSNMFMMLLWTIFAVLLFATRPNSLRGQLADKRRSNDSDDGPDNSDLPPPPAVQ